MGLPGSGKSTLARGLKAWLGWQHSFRIGTYHKGFPSTVEGDLAAWQAMLEDMAASGWDHFILETSGMDARWNDVLEHCGPRNVLTFKLECDRRELIRRIAAKSSEDQAHGDWFPPDRFEDKIAYVQAVFAEFSSKPAEVVLNTTRASHSEMLDLVMRFISTRKSFLEDSFHLECKGQGSERSVPLQS
ncbi:MAG: ATP-binding protein [Acidobacteriia bacterium]|nr:ATP-binding protein [Terriglobia bacterium]